MSSTAKPTVGRFIPTTTSAMRPQPATELRAYGGVRLFSGKRVLDIGTGDGRLALGTVGWARAVVGLDPDPSAIRGAKANARRIGARNASFHTGSAQELPFPDGSFDVVILSWTL